MAGIEAGGGLSALALAVGDDEELVDDGEDEDDAAAIALLEKKAAAAEEAARLRVCATRSCEETPEEDNAEPENLSGAWPRGTLVETGLNAVDDAYGGDLEGEGGEEEQVLSDPLESEFADAEKFEPVVVSDEEEHAKCNEQLEALQQPASFISARSERPSDTLRRLVQQFAGIEASESHHLESVGEAEGVDAHEDDGAADETLVEPVSGIPGDSSLGGCGDGAAAMEGEEPGQEDEDNDATLLENLAAVSGDPVAMEKNTAASASEDGDTLQDDAYGGSLSDLTLGSAVTCDVYVDKVDGEEEDDNAERGEEDVANDVVTISDDEEEEATGGHRSSSSRPWANAYPRPKIASTGDEVCPQANLGSELDAHLTDVVKGRLTKAAKTLRKKAKALKSNAEKAWWVKKSGPEKKMTETEMVKTLLDLVKREKGVLKVMNLSPTLKRLMPEVYDSFFKSLSEFGGLQTLVKSANLVWSAESATSGATIRALAPKGWKVPTPRVAAKKASVPSAASGVAASKKIAPSALPKLRQQSQQAQQATKISRLPIKPTKTSQNFGQSRNVKVAQWKWKAPQVPLQQGSFRGHAPSQPRPVPRQPPVLQKITSGKQPWSPSLQTPAAPATATTSGVVTKCDNEGRPIDLTRIVVNFANVGATYGVTCEKRTQLKFSYEGVRRCVEYLISKHNLKIIGVVFENSKTVPRDIEALCESIQYTPRLTGQHHKSADDEMTIKCAYRRNCLFLDNDNYRDWISNLKDDNVRAWLQHCQDFLQMRYFFDSGLGTFDTLDGNKNRSQVGDGPPAKKMRC